MNVVRQPTQRVRPAALNQDLAWLLGESVRHTEPALYFAPDSPRLSA